MSSVVQDLEAALQAMQNTNPPGVSGTKINYITELSANNVQVLDHILRQRVETTALLLPVESDTDTGIYTV